MVNAIEARECTLGQIFGNDFEFEIPPYQRLYAWEQDQVEELLSDLLDAMDNGSAGGVYFLGSIVLIKQPNQPEARVVDGQQRLTSLTILLSVLRDLTTDPELKILRRNYVFQKANPDSGAEDRYRLLLRQRDRDFFRKNIQIADATKAIPSPKVLEGSQQNIARNGRYFRDTLEKMHEDRRNKLVAFIIQRCYLVVVAVPTPEAARRIFTVLNARGLDLTPTDILKADLLERAGSVREKDLANRWETAELNLGRDEMVELFGHIRMIYERDKPRMALEEGFPKFVAPFNEDAEKFVSEVLEPIVDAFVLLSDNDDVETQFGADVAKAVRSLQRIDNKDWLPPALIRLWHRKDGDEKTVGQFLRDLERLAYYLSVTRADINARISRYASVTDEVDPRKDRPKPKKGIDLSAVEISEFKEALDGPLYQKARVCKPILQRLDEALSGGGASYDKLVSIEHVLPQTVSAKSEWEALFPNEEARSQWTHRLANLVFLTKRINTKASNWDFERKKTVYFTSKDGTSPFPITQGVIAAKEWSTSHLLTRQKSLLAKLDEVWRL